MVPRCAPVQLLCQWQYFYRRCQRRVPGTALCQHQGLCKLQQPDLATALGQCSFLAHRPAHRRYVYQYLVFHHVFPIQPAGKQHQHQHAVSMALQAGVRFVHRLYRQLLSRTVCSENKSAGAEAQLLVEFVGCSCLFRLRQNHLSLQPERGSMLLFI